MKKPTKKPAKRPAKKPSKPKLKELVISRAGWLRGGTLKPGQTSELLSRVDGRMCCLGFLGRACGLRKSEIEDLGLPSAVAHSVITKWPSEFVEVIEEEGVGVGAVNTSLCVGLSNINDSSLTNDRQKEKKIKDLFSMAGWKVKFVP